MEYISWRSCTSYLRCLFILIGLSSPVLTSDVANWVIEPSISDFQITSGRISTVDVNALQNCMVECYISPRCVTVGYSAVYMGCQLYDIDLADFTQNKISQPHTSFYKAVCMMTGYSHIRTLGLCVKRYTTNPLPMTNASAICASEGGSLMKVDTADKGVYLQDILFHIHDISTGFAYRIGGEWNYMSESWEWQDGTPIDASNGMTYWHTGNVPDNTSGDCLALTNSGRNVRFEVVDCTVNMPFICSFTKA